MRWFPVHAVVSLSCDQVSFRFLLGLGPYRDAENRMSKAAPVVLRKLRRESGMMGK